MEIEIDQSLELLQTKRSIELKVLNPSHAQKIRIKKLEFLIFAKTTPLLSTRAIANELSNPHDKISHTTIRKWSGQYQNSMLKARENCTSTLVPRSIRNAKSTNKKEKNISVKAFVSGLELFLEDNREEGHKKRLKLSETVKSEIEGEISRILKKHIPGTRFPSYKQLYFHFKKHFALQMEYSTFRKHLKKNIDIVEVQMKKGMGVPKEFITSPPGEYLPLYLLKA